MIGKVLFGISGVCGKIPVVLKPGINSFSKTSKGNKCIL
nr:MAG TPA: hypothetical protein [Caudoviricetes sp.]